MLNLVAYLLFFAKFLQPQISYAIDQLELPIVGPKIKGSAILTFGENSTEFKFDFLPMNLSKFGKIKWSIRQDLAVYGPKVFNECKRLKKQKILGGLEAVTNQLLIPPNRSILTLKQNDIIGHSIIFEQNSPENSGSISGRNASTENIACANILPILSFSNWSQFDKKENVMRLMRSDFRNWQFSGHIYILVLTDRLRFIPKLRKNERNGKHIELGWALVAKWWNDGTRADLAKCKERENQWSPQSSKSSYITTNPAKTVTIGTGDSNVRLENSILMLFAENTDIINNNLTKNKNKELFDCADITIVTSQMATFEDIQFIQNSPFQPVTTTEKINGKMFNSYSCEDVKQENSSQTFINLSDNGQKLRSSTTKGQKEGNIVYTVNPKLTLFGSDSFVLRTIQMNDEKCARLRLGNSVGQSAVARFYHPIVGDVIFTDIGDGTLAIRTNLRHLFDSKDTKEVKWTLNRGTLSGRMADLLCASGKSRLSHKDSKGRLLTDKNKICNNQNCGIFGSFNKKIGSPTVVAYNSSREQMFYSIADDFSIENLLGNNIQVDIGWTKACANITLLGGSETAIAILRRYSPVRAPRVGQFRLRQDFLNQQTTITLSTPGASSAYNVSIHERPIDLSMASAPPCGQRVLGTEWSQAMPSLESMMEKFSAGSRKTVKIDMPMGQRRGTVSTFDYLGRTLVLTGQNELICGTVWPQRELRNYFSISAARFNGPKVFGFIKMTQQNDGSSIDSFSTVIVYELNTIERTATISQDKFEWQILDEMAHWSNVNHSNVKNACHKASAFNPFHVQTKMDLKRVCQENERLCPVGEVGLRTGILRANSRKSLNVANVPLAGPFSVIGHYLRLKKLNTPKDDWSECALIEQWTEKGFQWMVPSNWSRKAIQKSLAEKFQMNEYQVAVSYSRDFYGLACAAFTIKISGTGEEIEAAMRKFDENGRKFNDDIEMDCPEKPFDFAPNEPSDKLRKMAPKLHSSNLFIINLFFVLYYLYSLFDRNFV